MRRRRLVILVALVLLIPACDPDPGGSPNDTWEWMFRGANAHPITRRQCQVLWAYAGGPHGPNAANLQTAAAAGSADMERLTGVPVTYIGESPISDLVRGANFPVFVSWHELGSQPAWSMPHYGDVAQPKDPIGGTIRIDPGRSVLGQTALSDLLRHEWAHQFNIGDTYDASRTVRYHLDEDTVYTFDHEVAIDAAFEDDSQRMGNATIWGRGDKNGLWEAGTAGRDDSCFRLIRVAAGTYAFRMFRAIHGYPTFAELVWFAARVSADPVQAAREILELPADEDWLDKGRDVFLTDGWTALTGAAPTPAKLDDLRDEWAAAGTSPRPTTFASMANSPAAKAYLEERQGVVLVYANVLGRMPTSAELTTRIAEIQAGGTYIALRDDLYFGGEGIERYRPGP